MWSDRRVAMGLVLLGGLILPSPLRADPPGIVQVVSAQADSPARWSRKTSGVDTPASARSALDTSLIQADPPGAERAPPTPPAVKTLAPPPRPGARIAPSQAGTAMVEAAPAGPEQAIAPPQETAPPPPFMAEQALTLEQIDQFALANNPTLVQAMMRIEAAQGKCVQVGLRPNPTMGYQGEEMGSLGTAGQQGAFVAQEFVTAGKLQLRRAVVAQEVVEAEHGAQAQRQRVLNDVR